MSSELAVIEKAPRAARPRWSTRILLVLGAAVVVPVGATVVYNFPPSEYNFYPRCIFHSVTGFHCAGCGATRCVGALVRGDIEQAFAFNPLFILLLPLIAYGGSRLAYEMWTGKKLSSYAVPTWVVKIVAGLLVVFSIARNIPVYPFDLMAPHEIQRPIEP